MGLSNMFNPRFVQRLWVRKNSLFPNLILFINMLVGRKLLPPSPMFLKVCSIMLKIVNMLRMKCFMFPKLGKVCLIGFCKVWHMRAWKKSFKFALYLFQGRNPCLDMKTQMVCCKFYKWKIVHKSISVTILIGPWLKMHDIIKASITKVMNTTNYIFISCDVVINVDNYSSLSLHGYVHHGLIRDCNYGFTWKDD